MVFELAEVGSVDAWYNNFMIDISVIVPVHNAEKFLGRCLKSVIAALESVNGEIVLVDDHSTDNSARVMEDFQREHLKLIRVLHCNTRGASAARNFGVARAKGRYLWFIDADDYISSSAIARLLRKADKTKADLVMMGAERIYSGGQKDYLSPVSPKESNYKSRFVRYGMGPWQVLIRRKWWVEHAFSFKEGIIHEDMELMSSLILYTDKFVSINEPLYFYCQNPESVLHKEKFSPHIFDIFPALEGLYQKFVEANATEKYHDELEWFFIWNLLIDSAKDFGKFPEGKSGFARSRKMLQKYFPDWRKNKFLRQKPLKLRVLVILNYLRG